MLMRSRIFRFKTLVTTPEAKPRYPISEASTAVCWPPNQGVFRNLSAMLMTIATHSNLTLMSDKKPGFGLGKNKPSIFAMLTIFSKKNYPNLTITVPTISFIARSTKGKLPQQYRWTIK